eukprot:TRINITY_DN2810_c0_g1_i1.p1 TRINITY_DN2810_c0_g1~~TRINITY_DN2810_c0_g1_i1.p1  ORF type:complete len:522 (+),score=172.53 TRINITY_DN2810_c0_g1_i1:79-1644(+)
MDPNKKRKNRLPKQNAEEDKEAEVKLEEVGKEEELEFVGRNKKRPGAAAQRRRNEEEEDDDDEEEELDFEDPWEDEVDEDEEEVVEGENSQSKEEEDDDNSMGVETGQLIDEEEEKKQPLRVWRPGVDDMGSDEKLDYESSAYTMLHRMNVEWPSLSLDILRDSLGEFRSKFPMTMYVVAGTQAEKANKNKVSIFKMSDLNKTKHDDAESDDEDESDDDDLDDDPVVEERSFPHQGGVNRIRAMPQQPNIVATFADTAKVHIWDIQPLRQALDAPPTQRIPKSPLLYSTDHTAEGFAMSWSSMSLGRLATGDCDGNIYLWQPHNGTWRVTKNQFRGHTGSVEDIQWSPNEPDVFVSCSVDRSIRVWDVRAPSACQLAIENVHTSDINVVSWNTLMPELLVSGSDDGSFKIWNFRQFSAESPMGHFTWHSKPITSVEWHPHEETTLAVASEDNSISIWDLSLEPDPEAAAEGADLDDDVPPQLLFVHQGQQDIKEVHFHPQIPSCIVSTSLDGFNIFKPSNM